MLSKNESPLEELLAKIGLQPNFIEELLHEGDWSFVIKLHALFESLVGSLILEELGRSELNEVVSNMGFSVYKSGKVDTAKALGLLTSVEKKFLNKLSALRNTLVHNISQTDFKFTEMDAKEKDDFFKGFTLPSCPKHLQITNPKILMLTAAHEVMLGLYYKRSKTKKKFLIAALNETR